RRCACLRDRQELRQTTRPDLVGKPARTFGCHSERRLCSSAWNQFSGLLREHRTGRHVQEPMEPSALLKYIEGCQAAEGDRHRYVEHLNHLQHALVKADDQDWFEYG